MPPSPSPSVCHPLHLPSAHPEAADSVVKYRKLGGLKQQEVNLLPFGAGSLRQGASRALLPLQAPGEGPAGALPARGGSGVLGYGCVTPGSAPVVTGPPPPCHSEGHLSLDLGLT